VDRDRIKGTGDKAKGARKDTASKMTRNKKLQTEGKPDKANGAAHTVAGDVKGAVAQRPGALAETRRGCARIGGLDVRPRRQRSNDGDRREL